LTEARAAGLTKSSLKGSAWRRLGAELYCWSGLTEDPWQVLRAWQDSLPADAVFSGATAAWIWGLDCKATDPVQVVVPADSGLRTRPGLSVRRCQIAPPEAITVRGLRTLTVHSALWDLCLRWPEVEVLVAIDMALCGRLTDVMALHRYVENVAGRPGARRLRILAALAAPAESPMETRLRWLLIQRGLPRPEVQTNLGDEKNQLGRADLYYPAARLILEYDGANHRDRLVEDNRRQNRLLNAGFRLLRFTAADIRNQPDLVETLVRGALAGSAPRGRPVGAKGMELSKTDAPLAPTGRNAYIGAD
jgi:very-short-patch-repair endonuclease